MTDTPAPTEPDAAPAEDDDLVIEDLTDDPWPMPTPRICICTVSAE
ncbi:hypothetical protein [Streptomyces sp. NPDC005336]